MLATFKVSNTFYNKIYVANVLHNNCITSKYLLSSNLTFETMKLSAFHYTQT